MPPPRWLLGFWAYIPWQLRIKDGGGGGVVMDIESINDALLMSS